MLTQYIAAAMKKALEEHYRLLGELAGVRLVGMLRRM